MEKTILIVDDDALFLLSLEDHLLLAHPEIRVETARDGVEALRILDSTVIDLVATDVRMPKLDGLELLASIVSAGLRIPVIVFSAFVDAPLREEAELFGAFAVFDKPVDLARLSETIQSGLRGPGGGELKGISVAGFLQLLQMERKSCQVNVTSGKEEGSLYFFKGELVHAQWGHREGDEAAQAIVGWDPAEIKMQGDRLQRPKTVEMSLTHLLLESAKAEDESDRSRISSHGFSPPSAPRAFEAPKGQHHASRMVVEVEGEEVRDTFAKLKELQGFLAAALLRKDDERCWTLGAIQAENLEEAARHCASALEAREALSRQLGTESGAGWHLSITMARHFYLARRLGSHGALLVVLNRNVGTLASAMREVAALSEQLEPFFSFQPSQIKVSSSRSGAAMGLGLDEGF